MRAIAFRFRFSFGFGFFALILLLHHSQRRPGLRNASTQRVTNSVSSSCENTTSTLNELLVGTRTTVDRLNGDECATIPKSAAIIVRAVAGSALSSVTIREANSLPQNSEFSGTRV